MYLLKLRIRSWMLLRAFLITNGAQPAAVAEGLLEHVPICCCHLCSCFSLRVKGIWLFSFSSFTLDSFRVWSEHNYNNSPILYAWKACSRSIAVNLAKDCEADVFSESTCSSACIKASKAAKKCGRFDLSVEFIGAVDMGEIAPAQADKSELLQLLRCSASSLTPVLAVMFVLIVSYARFWRVGWLRNIYMYIYIYI